MRYRPEHKDGVHQKIVKDASRRIRSEGLTGAAVSTVMRDSGLTHGGFYKHFENKNELLIESLRDGFREIEDRLVQAAQQSEPETAWKAIVRTYLSLEHCNHADSGCPLVSLGPELARADRAMKPELVGELLKYKDRMVPFMPGRRAADKERAFFAIFSTMVGAIEIARLLPEPAMREKVLSTVRGFLLSSFQRSFAILHAPANERTAILDRTAC